MVSTHSLLADCTVVGIHACRDIDSKNILFALVQQLAGTQNVALQLAMEAGAQQRIDKHVCLACCQLCQNPIILCAQRLHAASGLRKHSQLQSSITLHSVQRSANNKGTHAHAIALQPACCAQAIAAVIAATAENNYTLALQRRQSLMHGLSHSLRRIIHQ